MCAGTVTWSNGGIGHEVPCLKASRLELEAWVSGERRK